VGVPVGVQSAKEMTRRWRRRSTAVVIGLSLLLLAGCSEEDKNQLRHYAFPGDDPRNARRNRTTSSTSGVGVGSQLMIVGVITVGPDVLGVLGVPPAQRRRRYPVQTRYNLPLELFYTLAPVIMVVVLFFHTVQIAERGHPQADVERLHRRGSSSPLQQWSWTFNYRGSSQPAKARTSTSPVSRVLHADARACRSTRPGPVRASLARRRALVLDHLAS
jgi:cytochrome c oxidase subunit 2